MVLSLSDMLGLLSLLCCASSTTPTNAVAVSAIFQSTVVYRLPGLLR